MVSVQSSSNAVSVIQKLGGESNAAHMSVDFLRMLNAVHMCISVEFPFSSPYVISVELPLKYRRNDQKHQNQCKIFDVTRGRVSNAAPMPRRLPCV